MPPETLTASDAPPARTSRAQRLLNIFVTPGEVFDEVVAAPTDLWNWRVPMLLVTLAGIVLLQFATPHPNPLPIPWGEGGNAHAELDGGWPLVSSLVVCLAVFAGSVWSAFVLWLMGRVFLKVRFPYLKALEVVGLAGMILVLGSVVTALWNAASGDAAARPALSLLTAKFDLSQRARQILDTLNFFHLWSTAVLAIGLSRLTGVSFKEAAFWVFGVWFVVRGALIILG
jgi:hypothetical protein